MAEDYDLSTLPFLPMPVTIEVSVGNDGATTHVLPLWLHANYPWRAWAWLDQFELTAPNTDSSALENADSH